MKKFLSLMLAMIMVMSLVTVGAGAADFADAEAIAPEYAEAVELMYGLKILEGSNGAFDPKGNLTRGAAAKIIAYIALGAEKADKMTYTEKVFPDVELTSSTAPYIAWCYEQGIVNGYSDGNFGRKNSVTGYAFLKMVLGAIGVYGKYTGTGWENVVLTTAAKKDLLVGIDQDTVGLFSDPVSREVASQIAFNAMKYNRGEGEDVTGYLVDGTLFTGETALLNAANYIALMKLDVTPRFVFIEGGKLLEKTHKVAAPVTGVIVANQATGEKYTKVAALTTTLKDGKVDAITAIADTAADYNVTTELGDIGKVVTVYFNKTGKDGTVFAVTEKSTTKTVAEEIAKKDDMKAVFGDPTKIKTAAEVLNFVDYTGVEADVITGFSNTAYTAKVGTYVLYEGIILGYMAPANKTLTKVEDIDNAKDAKYITLTSYEPLKNGVKSGTTTTDEVIEYADIAEGDYVVVTQVGKLYNLEKAVTKTGKPTKIDGTALTIGDVEYKQYGTNKSDKKAESLSLTKEVTLYLDGQGNYIVATKVDNGPVDVDIVYVADKYSVKVDAVKNAVDKDGFPIGDTEEYYTYFAQIVTMDGDKTVYPITAKQYAAIETDTLYKMTVATKAEKDEDTVVNKNGSTNAKDWTCYKAKFASFTQEEVEGDEYFIGATKTDEVKTTSIKLNSVYYLGDDVTFLWISGDQAKLKVEKKDGVQAIKATEVELVYEKDEDGNKLVAYVIIETEFKADTVYTGDLVYIVADDTSDKQVAVYKDGSTEKVAYGHKGYVNGVETDLTLVNDQKTIKQGFYKVIEEFAGVQELVELAKDETFVVANAEFTMFKSLMTIKGAETEDIDVTGVKVVDLRDVETKITDATKITVDGEYEISVVLEKNIDKTGNTIKTIYIHD